MFTVLLILHIIVSGLLVLSILLQSGQAGGLSGAFGGGGGTQTLFGGRGASTFLSKATAYLAGGFLVICFLLAFVQAHRSAGEAGGGRNIIRQELAPAQEAQPPSGQQVPAGAPGGTETMPQNVPTQLPVTPEGGESGSTPAEEPNTGQ